MREVLREGCRTCSRAFGRSIVNPKGAGTEAASLSLDGGGPAAFAGEDAAASIPIPRRVTPNTRGDLIELIWTPPSPPGFIHGVRMVLVVLLEVNAGVAQSHLLELGEWRRGTVPALRELAGCTDTSGHDRAVRDPVCNFLHAVQAGAGLSALMAMSARTRAARRVLRGR